MKKFRWDLINSILSLCILSTFAQNNETVDIIPMAKPHAKGKRTKTRSHAYVIDNNTSQTERKDTEFSFPI
jgi:hypothetical protein